ncbi:MAG: hypothetical protein WB680_09075 [Candidatus Acidiferrales bacterium]
MNTWSEANFLERLMPPAELKSSAKKDPCPEDELLVAFSENRLGGFVWDAVAEHLTRCTDCSELQHRLLKFSSVAVDTDKAEWGNAEKRLENWMDAFLQSHAPEVLAGELSRPAVLIPRSEPARNLGNWRPRWAWSAVAGLAVVAGAVLVLQFGLARQRGGQQVAMQAPAKVTPQVAPQSLPAAGAGAIPPESVSTVDAAKTESAVNLAGRQSKPSGRSGSAAGISSYTPAAHKAVSNRDGGKLVAARPADGGSPSANAAASPADAALSTATRAASQLASAVGAAISSASGESPAAGDGSQPVAASRSSTTATHAALPASISLLDSVPIRIRLTSGSIPADGSFEFRGNLLEPAIPVIGIVLDRATEIRGVGTVRDGEISVVIKEVIVRGVRYPLKAGSGAAKARRVNSGDALEVSFDEGSVYEKVTRANGAPATGSVATVAGDGRL